jgi:CRISPR/Cas system-associated exonuclease Cas4 (RecB family)
MGKASAKARAEAREGAQRQAAQNAERQHLQKRSKKLAEFLEACAIGLDRTSKGGPDAGLVMISVSPLLAEHGGEVSGRLVGLSGGLSQEDVTKIKTLVLKAHKTARPDDFTPSGRQMLLEQYKANPMYCSIQ